MVYVTEPLEMPSVLLSTWEMTLPAPAEAPLTFVGADVQVNVVPVTELGLVMATEVVDPEQMVWGNAEAEVTGLTVTT